MKKIYGLTVMLFFAATTWGQTTAAPEPIQFKELSYDFGKVPQGKPVYHFFELVNTGSQPVKLENVHASCGCTTPEWSKDEIAPGASTRIRVGFNAASEGPFDKTVTVQYGTFTRVLKIRGEVWRGPEGPAPANSAVQFLKQQITIKP